MKKEEIVIKALKLGPKRSSELEALGVSRASIMRLREKRVIEKLGRGVYGLADADYDENQTLVEVCKQAPKGVICLLSALQYYGITTEQPHKVWLAIERSSWQPSVTYPPVKICYFGANAFSEGIEIKETPTGTIRIYKPAKTVADCFKYRNKIGKDVAITALKDCRRMNLATMNDISRYAKICKVYDVMRPYMEAIVSD